MRKTWPDVAKGGCIILVVLWHVITKHYLSVDWNTGLPIPAAWGSLGEQLLPLRMPLFFTISGMFAAGAVQRPWSVVVSPRVARFAYLYALWLLIHTVIMWFTPDFDTAAARTPLKIIEYLTITPTNLWYLYALALYFVIAKVTRQVPMYALLPAAFLLSAVAAAHLLPEPSNRGQVYQNLVFFLAGLYLRSRIEQLADSADGRRLIGFTAAYVVALLAMAAVHAQTWFGVWPLVSVVAIGFGVTAAAWVPRWPRIAAPLATLGRSTLPIYVMHLPLLAILDRLLRGPLGKVEPKVPLLVAVEPILLVAFLVMLCLWLHNGLRKVGAVWLFELPRRAPKPAGLMPRQMSHAAKSDGARLDWFDRVAEQQRARSDASAGSDVRDFAERPR